MEQTHTETKSKFRLNVFVLFFLGYLAITLMFFFMICDDHTSAKEAVELIENPLLVLVSGTVAVIKDLV